MEVIKRGDWQPPTFTAELVCYNCHSVLKINADDILSVYDDWDGSSANYQVTCPVCYSLNINTGLLILKI